MDKEYIIKDEDLVTKAGWTPFNNVKVKGCIERVVFNNVCVYNNNLAVDLPLGQNVNIYKNNSVLNVSKQNVTPSLNSNVNVETSQYTPILQSQIMPSNITSNKINNKSNNKLSDVINVKQFDRDNLRSLFKDHVI